MHVSIPTHTHSCRGGHGGAAEWEERLVIGVHIKMAVHVPVMPLCISLKEDFGDQSLCICMRVRIRYVSVVFMCCVCGGVCV